MKVFGDRLKFTFKICISFSLLYYLYRHIDLNLLWQALGTVNAWHFILAELAAITFILLSTTRLFLLLQDSPEARQPYFSLLRIYSIGLFFSFFSPGGISADVVRVLQLKGNGGMLSYSIQSILLERGLGFLALLTLCCPWFYPLTSWDVIPLFLRNICGGMMVSGTLIFLALLLGWQKKIPMPGLWKTNLSNLRPKTLISALLVSFSVQGVSLVVYFQVAKSLGLGVGFLVQIPAIFLSSIANMLPISIQGLGVNEGIFVHVLHHHGVPVERAILFSLLVFMTSVITGLLGGILFILERNKGGQELRTGLEAKKVIFLRQRGEL